MGGSGPLIDKLELAAQAFALPSPALAKMRLTFRQGGPSDLLQDLGLGRLSKADRARMVKTRQCMPTFEHSHNARSNQLCPIFVGRLKHFFSALLHCSCVQHPCPTQVSMDVLDPLPMRHSESAT